MTKKIKEKMTEKAGLKVKVGGVIADGKKGFLNEGDAVPAGVNVESLKAKGLIG